MKTTLRIALIFAITASLGLLSCDKEYVTRTCEKESQVECGFDSNMVNVRVANYSGYPLCDFEVVYRDNDQTVYDYGTLDVGETSCYTKMDFTKIYPEITFNLGSGTYVIPDSLIYDDKYNSLKQTTDGFYTFLINIPDLDSLMISTIFVVEHI